MRAGQRDRSATTLLVGLIAFLTVVDLFATQAILPALTRAYGTTPAVMSFAVNASTIGMAISDSRWRCSAIASTAGPASWSAWRCCRCRPCCCDDAEPRGVRRSARGPGTAHGSGLHVDPGLYGETSSPQGIATAFAAYITGNVASNLFGRLVSAAVADHFGLAWNFYAFAALNLCGALAGVCHDPAAADVRGDAPR